MDMNIHTAIMQKFNNAKTKLVRLSERSRLVKERMADLGDKQEQAETEENLLSKATMLLRELGGQARELILTEIDPIARRGLQEIFGEDAQYQTTFRKLPKQGYSARIVSGMGNQLASPLSTDGGSTAEVLSDAVLRELVIYLHHPRLSRVLILDEPYSGVDRIKMAALGNFLSNLCDDLSIQLIITTHEPGELDQYANTIITLPVEDS